ncbi:hypothetical protein, partial [Polycladomyces subterraneus]
AYKVSPIKGSSGRVARPVAMSYHLGWHGVTEPKYSAQPVRILIGCPRIYSGEDVTNGKITV